MGVSQSDTDEDIEYLANKTVNMRLFPDPSNAARGFELSATEVGADILLVSQFTLYASTRKGRRPGFTDAAPPDVAEPLFEKVVHAFRQTRLESRDGRVRRKHEFGTDQRRAGYDYPGYGRPQQAAPPLTTRRPSAKPYLGDQNPRYPSPIAVGGSNPRESITHTSSRVASGN